MVSPSEFTHRLIYLLFENCQNLFVGQFVDGFTGFREWVRNSQQDLPLVENVLILGRDALGSRFETGQQQGNQDGHTKYKEDYFICAH